MSAKKVFNIANKINEDTGEPFGDKYAEAITIRRPSAQDKISINVRHSGIMSAYGAVPENIPSGIYTLAFIFCTLDVLCDGARPDWTKKENVFEEDEAAIFALHQEVSQWLDTFRPRASQQKGE